MTVSGGVVEHWNARDGRHLSDPLDLYTLFPDGPDAKDFYVQRHYKPGYVQVTLTADRTLRAVRLASRVEDPDLRIRLGDDVVTAAVEPSARYAMVLTSGRIIELWSVADRRRTQKIFGSLGPLEPGNSQIGTLQEDDAGNPGFFLAYGRSVRFLRVHDSGQVDVTTYTFAGEQNFVAATGDGRALLRSPAKIADLLRLDPVQWRSHVCSVLGRDLAEDERRALPRGLPDAVCPLPGTANP
ncbi:hypothetical protein HCN51_05365 [Nonomuraea sp. FMUSA5-5]|uniref:Uncharacterized protein n=1 Tax=Nonomuraea composti TaxID=2720023 RepID=A0ABX1AZC9_9ACTN|nr:hypothetical protein [Nonomuraea sp. FMUSA5-5]